jgi:glycosyltransferase involved in cell wall biosynthesis
MRILHVIAGFDAAGAERMVVTLVAGSLERDVAVAVCAPPGQLDAELDARARRFVFADRGRSARGVTAAILAVARVCRRFNPDVVHAHNVKATAVAAAGSRLAQPTQRPPVLATLHGVAADEYRAAADILRRSADIVACVSEDVRRRLVMAGHPGQHTVVIRNGVAPATPCAASRRQQLDRELGLDGAPVVISVGRLAPVKAQDRFLAAAAYIRRAVPEARFLLVGDGPLRGALERQAAALGLSDTVGFTGARLDARELVARASLMLVTSRSEGLSVAVLEALAAGVAVVATDVPGMRELLEGGAGIVVRDASAEALAEQAVGLLRAPCRCARMGEIGRRLVSQRYAPARMVGEYLELADRLAAAQPALTSTSPVCGPMTADDASRSPEPV